MPRPETATQRRRSAWTWILALALLAGAGALFWRLAPSRKPADDPVNAAAHRLQGRELLDHFDCAFCHAGDPETPDALVDNPRHNCAHCHQQEGVARFIAPRLAVAAKMLKPEWLKRYLMKPHAVRPALRECMPEFGFDEAAADNLVRTLLAGVDRGGLPAAGTEPKRLTDPAEHANRLERGRQLYRDYGCAQCHVFTGFVQSLDLALVDRGDKTIDVRYFAPDLRHARDRVRPELLSSFIRQPTSIDPLILRMPSTAMPRQDADTLAYLLLYEDLAPAPPPERPAMIVARASYFRDVQPLLNKYCATMCHYPHDSELMGWGSGWVGGFGFAARKLDLTSYEGLMRGAENPDGTHTPVVTPGNRNSPLLQRLRGEILPAMPMGIKLSESEKRILETWVLEGAKKDKPPEDGD